MTTRMIENPTKLQDFLAYFLQIEICDDSSSG